jgi:hypothetical protein
MAQTKPQLAFIVTTEEETPQGLVGTRPVTHNPGSFPGEEHSSASGGSEGGGGLIPPRRFQRDFSISFKDQDKSLVSRRTHDALAPWRGHPRANLKGSGAKESFQIF